MCVKGAGNKIGNRGAYTYAYTGTKFKEKGNTTTTLYEKIAFLNAEKNIKR